MNTNYYHFVDTITDYTKYQNLHSNATYLVNYNLDDNDFIEKTRTGMRIISVNEIERKISQRIQSIVGKGTNYIIVLNLKNRNVDKNEKVEMQHHEKERYEHNYELTVRVQLLCSLLNKLWKLNKKDGKRAPVIVVGITEYELFVINRYVYGEFDFENLPNGTISKSSGKNEMQWDKELCAVFYVQKILKPGFPFYVPRLHFGYANKHVTFNYSDNLIAEVRDITTEMSEEIYNLKGILFEGGILNSHTKAEHNLLPEKDIEGRNIINEFIATCRLIEFDTVIQINEQTLFNLYATACLEQDIIPTTDESYFATYYGTINEDLCLPAFKIENLHTKIGRKTHMKDFYYDSKMFQNSFFSYRFACEIARYLLTERILPDKIQNDNCIFEIIGYGRYSELLISQVKKLLQQTINARKVTFSIASYSIADKKISFAASDNFGENNTESFSDETLLTQSKRRYILIIPTSVTSQTQREIIQEIPNRSDYVETSEIFAVINVIKICGNENKLDTYELKHIITSKREWYPEDECVLCFPDKEKRKVKDVSAEKPLVEIKKKYKSPIIFNNEFPFSGSRLEKYSLGDNIQLKPEHYQYGYSKIGSEHVHYIHSFKFFDTYEPKIREWLETLKNSISSSVNPNKKIALVALEGNFNHAFASLINEVIFSNKATLVHHNTKDDFIENSKGFYKDIVATSDLYYVDDLMLTGRTFMSFNNFIRQIWYDWDIEQKPFRGVFALIVRSYDFAINQVARELAKNGKIYVFKQLRVPPLYTYENMPNPIDQREIIYTEIARHCSLDRQKLIFFKRAHQLKNRHPNGILLDFFSEGKASEILANADNNTIFKVCDKISKKIENKDLCKLLITDIIFGILPKDFDRLFGNYSTLNDLVNYVWKYLSTPSSYKNKISLGFSYEEWKEMIIKVISVPPFTYYSNIQNSLMCWMIQECERVMKKLSSEKLVTGTGLNIFETHYEYRYLKLLFRRLANFKSTYLLRKQTLENLAKIYHINKARKENWDKYTHNKKAAIIKIVEIITDHNISEEDVKIYLHSIRKEDAAVIKSTAFRKEISVPLNTEIKKKLTYYFQIIKNCNDLFSILHGSPSFITGCIKEVIYANPPKAIFLRESIERFDLSTNNPDFNHLLLLLYLENTEIEEVIHDEDIIKLKSSFSDSDILQKAPLGSRSPMFKIDKYDIPDPSAVLAGFMTNFKEIIKSGLNTQDSTLDVMMRIIDNSKQRTSDFWLIGEKFYTPVLNPPHNIPNVLVDMMFNKILDSSGLPQTFVMFKRQHKKWESFLKKLKRKVRNTKGDTELADIEYEVELKDYTEAGYELLFCFRISSIEYLSTPQNNEYYPGDSFENRVSDTTQAVIFVGVKVPVGKKINFPDRAVLRKTICIKEAFSDFLRKSIQNDAFSAYIKKMGDGMRVVLSAHSIDEYDKMFREMLFQSKSDSEEIEKLLIMHILGNQSAILNRKYERVMKSKNVKNITNTFKDEFSQSLLKKNELVALVNNIVEVVFKHQEVNENRYNIDVSGLLDIEEFSIEMDKDLIIIFVSEVFINISKQILHTTNGIIKIAITASKNIRKNKLECCLVISNSYFEEADQILQIERMQKIIAGSKSVSDFHGLDLVNYFYSSIFDNDREKNWERDEKNKIFYTYLPLINYKEIAHENN